MQKVKLLKTIHNEESLIILSTRLREKKITRIDTEMQSEVRTMHFTSLATTTWFYLLFERAKHYSH